MSREILDAMKALAIEKGIAPDRLIHALEDALMNIDGDGFARLARENSAYYALGYYSTNELHDGAFRKNDVSVNRKGIELQYRRGYFASEAR